MKYPLTSLSVTRIQRRLAELGIYKGKIDGDEGPLTIKAIRGFQRINGLKDDGIIGPSTESELFPAISAPLFPDIDPRFVVRNPWPFERDVEKFYGPKGQNQAILQLPYRMFVAWDLRKSVTQFSIHEKVHDSALRCFNRILDAYPKPSQRNILGIDLFGGCLNVRKKRGGTTYSMHSWGIAIDFDPARNQLRWGRDRARLAQPDAEAFWRIWEEEKWMSLGRARNYDHMHVEACRL